MSVEEILEKFDKVTVNSVDDVTNIRNEYLGKSGYLSLIMREMKNIPADERPAFGEKVNRAKVYVEDKLNEFARVIEEKDIEKKLKGAKRVDLTIPLRENVGSLHPITVIQKRIVDVFVSMGFSIEDGNEVETEFNNFEAVNVPKDHPARDMQDTFFLDNGQLLKTHTSASQNRIMRKYGAPCKVVFPGRCFRNEDVDASHDNTFFQVEGMMIDKDISISNLIYFMKEMLSKIFNKDVEVRLRPGFFPFVEPGFELDCQCPYCGGKGCNVCKGTGWIELCPCGMIHPKVLKMGGIDTDKYQGFAFGLGLSRLVMMVYNVDDIRKLNGADLRVLKDLKLN